MSKLPLLLGGVAITAMLAFAFVSFGSASSSLPEPTPEDVATPLGTPTPEVSLSDEGTTEGTAQQISGSDEIPSISQPVGVQLEVPAAPSAGLTTTVYFVPQDNDANATVLFLYNTDTVTHTVSISGYNESGAPAGSWNIDVGPKRLVRAVSDSVAASPPPSWVNAVVVNFTDFTFIASMAVPQSVKVDGYVIFNPGTGTVDPRADQGAIPLRFSADPLNVFLPTVNRSP